MNFHPSREIAGMKTRLTRVFRAVVTAVAVAAPQAAFAQSTDIAVLHSKVDHANLSIERLDDKFTEHLARLDDKFTKRLDRMDDKFTKRFERMDERLDRMDGRFERMDGRLDRLEQIVIRLDERMNGFQMQNQFVVIPLLLLLLATMFGLLTKGILWGVERAPQASSGASRRGGPSPQPAANPA